MKTILLFIISICFLACEKTDNDFNLNNDLQGTYLTDPAMDFSCAFLPPDQMPSVIISKKNNSSYDISVTRFGFINNKTKKITKTYKDISLSTDTRGTVLTYNNKEFGFLGKPKYITEKNFIALFINYQDQENQVFEGFIGKKSKK